MHREPLEYERWCRKLLPPADPSCFIDVLVLTVHHEARFLGEIQAEDLPTKQSTKQILLEL